MALFVLDLYTAAVIIFTGEDTRSGVELDDFEKTPIMDMNLKRTGVSQNQSH